MKPLLLTLLLVGMPVLVNAQFTFTTNNGAITITSYTGSAKSVEIPSMTNGFPVTCIGTNAFNSHTALTNVIIPDSVTNIAYQAFAACSGLTSVVTGTNLTDIGDRAFDVCTSLTNFIVPDSVIRIGKLAFHTCASLPGVHISSSVTNIGDGAFTFCYSLSAITVDALNPVYSSLDGVLFNKSQAAFIQCPGGKTGSYMIPNGVTSVSATSFAGCRNLQSITIPVGVTNIASGMFEYCQGLTNVSLPNSVTSIESFAFYACSSLRNITIPGSVTSIGTEAFAECYSLSALFFRGNAPSVGSLIFDDDNIGTVYYLPGTAGWGLNFQFWPTALWMPEMQTSGGSFGMPSNGFGFNINWAGGQTIVIEAATNLANPSWSPLQTNTLAGDSFYFSDPQWTNYPGRFYRLRSQ